MSKGLAVITGASAGIGETFARQLARGGYDLLLIARRLDRLQALATELSRAYGVTAEPLAADLACDEDLHNVEARIAQAGNLALLVNNAGFGVKGRFVNASVGEHDRMHRLHVLAAMRLCHAALRVMSAADQGAIVNVASVAGFIISPGGTSYSATKHWMNAFTEGLWLDLQTRGSHVRVQALCPGFTYSEFHDVMGMDRGGIPKAWWTTAEFVVSESLRGLETGKLFVIPGWRNRALVCLYRLAPGGLRRAGAIWFARRYKKQAIE
jgi:short-subunit dehydrogenase